MTGNAYVQLTNGPADSHHLYFTNSGWHQDSQRLIFISHRGGAANFYSMDLRDGSFRQLTAEAAQSDQLIFSAVNPCREELYFWRGLALWALDLNDLSERFLTSAPQGYCTDMLSVTSDGRYVLTAVYEDCRARLKIDLLNGHVGFDELWAAHPHSIILAIEIATGQMTAVHAERTWIGHVNASPRDPALATFCHEGPWGKVDNRIWALDLLNGRSWPIRPCAAGEMVGHEYWLEDGRRIGFHGASADGAGFIGSIGYDNTGLSRSPFPMVARHIHSNHSALVVCDGSETDKGLFVAEVEAGKPAGLRRLLQHQCSSGIQARHVHPRFSPDHRHVIFVSDRGGVGNLYSADVVSRRFTSAKKNMEARAGWTMGAFHRQRP